MSVSVQRAGASPSPPHTHSVLLGRTAPPFVKTDRGERGCVPLAVTELGGRSGRPGHCRVRRSRALRGHTRPSPGRPLLPEAVSTHAGTAAASQRFSPGGSDVLPPPPSRCGILCPMLTPPAEDEDSPGTGVPMATLLPPAPAPATMGHSHWLSYSSTERHFYTCGIQLIKKKILRGKAVFNSLPEQGESMRVLGEQMKARSLLRSLPAQGGRCQALRRRQQRVPISASPITPPSVRPPRAQGR